MHYHHIRDLAVKAGVWLRPKRWNDKTTTKSKLVSYLVCPLSVFPLEFRGEVRCGKTRVMGLPVV